MPKRAPGVCGKPGCGRLSDSRFCEAHANQDPRLLRRRQFDAARGSAHARGYGRRHEKLRLLILARDPLCRIAHFCDGQAPSTIADHIKPRNAGGEDSMENMQGACERCHNWKTATQDSKFACGARALGA